MQKRVQPPLPSPNGATANSRGRKPPDSPRQQDEQAAPGRQKLTSTPRRRRTSHPRIESKPHPPISSQHRTTLRTPLRRRAHVISAYRAPRPIPAARPHPHSPQPIPQERKHLDEY